MYFYIYFVIIYCIRVLQCTRYERDRYRRISPRSPLQKQLVYYIIVLRHRSNWRVRKSWTDDAYLVVYYIICSTRKSCRQCNMLHFVSKITGQTYCSIGVLLILRFSHNFHVYYTYFEIVYIYSVYTRTFGRQIYIVHEYINYFIMFLALYTLSESGNIRSELDEPTVIPLLNALNLSIRDYSPPLSQFRPKRSSIPLEYPFEYYVGTPKGFLDSPSPCKRQTLPF